jgi:preprotein translocase subunit YajC
MFISPAYAQAAGGANDMFIQMAPLVLIFVVFYFLLIRPQQKKAKTHRDMLGNLRKGDNVVTGGGIVGKVVKLDDDSQVIVEIADNVRVRVLRTTITDVLNKPEPAKVEAKAGEAKKD